MRYEVRCNCQIKDCSFSKAYANMAEKCEMFCYNPGYLFKIQIFKRKHFIIQTEKHAMWS